MPDGEGDGHVTGRERGEREKLKEEGGWKKEGSDERGTKREELLIREERRRITSRQATGALLERKLGVIGGAADPSESDQTSI